MIKHWFTLNKDGRDYGLASGQCVSTNITYSDGGPFGKAASFNGSSSYISLPNSVGTTAKEFTYAAFVKFNNVSAGQCLYSQRTVIGGGIAIFLVGGVIRFDIGNTLWSTTTTYQTNTWTHIAVTYGGGKKKLYINGVKAEEATAGTTSQIAVKATIGGSESADTGTACANWLNGQLSDVRVCDHMLEDWEIKKIYNTKALEMESGLYLPETTNLVTGLTRGGQTTIVDGEVRTTGTNADTYFTIDLSESIVSGNVYSISCYADMPDGTYWDFPLGTQSNTSLTWRLTHGYNKYTFTANSINWGTNRIFMDDQSGPARTSGQVCKFYKFQLEKRNFATPYSYKGRAAWSTDSANFEISSTPYNVIKSGSTIFFNGVDTAIQIPLHGIISAGTWSINLWFLKPAGMWSSKGYETLIGGPSGFELEAKSAATNVTKIIMWNWGHGSCDYEFDKWNMVTFTRTSSGTKLYLNGVQKATGSAGSMPAGDYFIGAWKTSTQQNFKGYIRRVSVYKKELTQEDITNLYLHNE